MARDRLLWTIITATALLGILLLLAQDASIEEPVSSIWSSADEPDPLALECLDHTGLARHDHVTLKIFIDGEREMIPSETGINSGV